VNGRPRRLVVVFGTATDIGKTWVSCRLIEAARAAGLKVAARKPAQSFDPPPASLPQLNDVFVSEARQSGSVWGTDAELLAAATGESPTEVCPTHRWYPLALAPPMAASWLGRPDIAVAELAAELTWPDGVDLGLVETAGGPRSPIAHDGDGIALAERLRPDLAVLVADAALGTINAVRLAAGVIAPTPVLVVLNRFDAADPLHAANLRWLRDIDRLDVTTDPAAVLVALDAPG
jgi:dethiobiotin synthetase